MSAVDRALSVLNLFSESAPNVGLSEIARQLGREKSYFRLPPTPALLGRALLSSGHHHERGGYQSQLCPCRLPS